MLRFGFETSSLPYPWAAPVTAEVIRSSAVTGLFTTGQRYSAR